MSFPFYIKYPNNRTFLKIESDSLMEEITYMGDRKSVRVFEAKTFPDRLYIQDLLDYLKKGLLIQIDKEEYEERLMS